MRPDRLRALPDVTLDQIAAHPATAEKITQTDATALLARLMVVQGVLITRLLTIIADDGREQAAGPEPDRLLAVDEAAQRLGVSEDYLYRHADQLPFTVRVGSRHLRFSAHGIDEYIRERSGR